MKSKLNTLTKTFILFLGISLLLFTCQKEDAIIEDSVVDSQAPKLSIQYITKDRIAKNRKLSSKLEWLTSKLYEDKDELSKKGGGKYISAYDFIIDTESATYIQEGDYHSYTFPLVQSKTENIKNILFTLNENDEYDSFIVEYEYTYNQLSKLDKDQLSKRTKIIPINLDFNSLLTARVQAYLFCVYEYKLVDTGDLYGAGNEQYEWVLTAKDCTTIWGTADYGDEYYESTVTTDTTTGELSYSGSGNLVTSPTLSNMYDEDDIIMFGMLKTNLSLNIAEYDWLIHHYPEAKEIFDFLGENFNSEEAISFANLAIENLMEGEKVDLEESFKSPFLVDLELVRPSILDPEPEKVKFMCIYNKLIKSSKFKQLFIDTFGESENLHVQFKIVDNIPPIPPSTTEPNGVTKTRALSINPTTGEILKYNAVIEINKSNMGVSSISLAKTILHESIHAYLTVKQYGCNQGTPLEGYDDVELSELLNIYFSTACPAQSDHEFMFDSLLPTMSDILADIKNDLVPLSHQQSAEEEMFIDESNPVGPEVPWDWNQFYEYLSMAGLQNSNAFKNNIENTPSKYANYKEYAIDYGINLFSKNCID